MKNIFYLFFAFSLGLTACKSRDMERSSISFYFWRTQLALDSLERSYLKSLEVKKLYVRFFDVAWNPRQGKAQPLGILGFGTDTLPLREIREIVPTVFITHQTLLTLPDSLRADLAQNITQQISKVAENQRFRQIFPSAKISEIQLDCDWTPSSRAAYFDLIALIKARLDSTQRVSITLRLHQYRYPQKTGIPPAAAASLMCYNTGNLHDLSTQNSILDTETVDAYLVSKQPYPIALNYAVPIFSWGVLIRSGRVMNLLSDMHAHDVSSANFQELKDKPQHFRVLKSHYFKGVYLYKNDLIRYEAIDNETLHRLAALLRQGIKGQPREWIFYHLNHADLEKFSVESLRKIAQP